MVAGVVPFGAEIEPRGMRVAAPGTLEREPGAVDLTLGSPLLVPIWSAAASNSPNDAMPMSFRLQCSPDPYRVWSWVSSPGITAGIPRQNGKYLVNFASASRRLTPEAS